MHRIVLLTIGSSVSVLGSQMTGYALAIWLLKTSGSVTGFAAMVVVSMITKAIFSPIMGPLIDRYPRRTVLLACIVARSMVGVVFIALSVTDTLSVGLAVITMGVGGIGEAAWAPAINSVPPILVERRLLAKANGLLRMSQGLGQLVAPALAGFAYDAIPLHWIIGCDTASFAIEFAFVLFIGRALAVRPEAPPTQESRWQVIAAGFRHIRSSVSLRVHLVIITGFAFVVGAALSIFTPYALTIAPVAVAGRISAALGSGAIAGGIALAVRRTPQRPMATLLAFAAAATLCLGLISLTQSPWTMAAAAFVAFFFMIMASGLAMTIWQVLVPTHLLGRVFAVRELAETLASSLGFIAAARLADTVLEPMARPGAAGGAFLRSLFGARPGAGFAALFAVLGVTGFVLALIARRLAVVRAIDHSFAQRVHGADR